tara:strand:+ start:724 stop:852 length:129 start_codon:yes stop_codon:yes gene_type:complete
MSSIEINNEKLKELDDKLKLTEDDTEKRKLLDEYYKQIYINV